jgi:hypothetical protein
MEMDAFISEDARYRYSLRRWWNPTGPSLVFAMLNPSTADAEKDDPTIRRCISFARREACAGIDIVNLYAYRASDPDRLATAGVDTVGPLNSEFLYKAARGAALRGVPVICAWGANPHATKDGIDGRALDIFRYAGAKTACLGITSKGAPRHPLYVKGDAPIVAYNGP